MISELLDGTRVRAVKRGCLNDWEESGSKWGERMDSDWKKREKERRTLWRETSRSIRRPEAARSNARIQFPRSFNHFECARFLQLSRSCLSSLSLSPFFPSFFHPVLASSRLPAGSRFVILANDVPFFQQPRLFSRYPTTSSKILSDASSSLYGLSPVSLITHEVIKIWQGDNFSNAAYTDFPWTKSETSTRTHVSARSHVNVPTCSFYHCTISKFRKLPL